RAPLRIAVSSHFLLRRAMVVPSGSGPAPWPEVSDYPPPDCNPKPALRSQSREFAAIGPPVVALARRYDGRSRSGGTGRRAGGRGGTHGSPANPLPQGVSPPTPLSGAGQTPPPPRGYAGRTRSAGTGRRAGPKTPWPSGRVGPIPPFALAARPKDSHA